MSLVACNFAIVVAMLKCYSLWLCHEKLYSKIMFSMKSSVESIGFTKTGKKINKITCVIKLHPIDLVH